MSVGVADPISEMFPDVMRSNICNAVYDRAARTSFELWGEWNLNGDEGGFRKAIVCKQNIRDVQQCDLGR
jgi:hypothetical protein